MFVPGLNPQDNIGDILKDNTQYEDDEGITEEELEILHKYYQRLAHLAKKEKDLSVSHSIEEAHELHREKYKTL